MRTVRTILFALRDTRALRAEVVELRRVVTELVQLGCGHEEALVSHGWNGYSGKWETR